MKDNTMKSLTIVNAIVVSRPVYAPKFVVTNGRAVSQRCEFIIFIRSNNKKRRGSYFHMIAWGDNADYCAKTCGPGTIISTEVSITSYLGTAREIDGTVLKDNNGETVRTMKTKFTISNIHIAGVLEKVISSEIKEGSRPAKWDNPLHPDYNVWMACIKTRMGIVYDGKSETFGFSDVRKLGEPVICKILDEYKRKVRLAHVRTFKHPRFVHMEGKEIAVKEAAIDPKF